MVVILILQLGIVKAHQVDPLLLQHIVAIPLVHLGITIPTILITEHLSIHIAPGITRRLVLNPLRFHNQVAFLFQWNGHLVSVESEWSYGRGVGVHLRNYVITTISC